jgi:hypothetical protein
MSFTGGRGWLIDMLGPTRLHLQTHRRDAMINARDPT